MSVRAWEGGERRGVFYQMTDLTVVPGEGRWDVREGKREKLALRKISLSAAFEDGMEEAGFRERQTSMGENQRTLQIHDGKRGAALGRLKERPPSTGALFSPLHDVF